MNVEIIAQPAWNPIQPAIPFLEFEAAYVCGLIDLIERVGLLNDGIDTQPEDPREFDPDWLIDCQDYADCLSLLDLTGNLDAMV